MKRFRGHFESSGGHLKAVNRGSYVIREMFGKILLSRGE